MRWPTFCLLIPTLVDCTTTATADGAGASGPGDQATTLAGLSTTGTGFLQASATGTGGSAACAATSVDAVIERKPVDLIVVVDTSPTMEPASSAVEANINQNLAQILTSGSIDYRIIVLAGYGSGANLCVGPPLGGASCAVPPATPANTATFFHYGNNTGSVALLQSILDWYETPDPYGLTGAGWSSWLRADSLKVFLALSDTSGDSSLSASEFDAKLLSLVPPLFGTAASRQYVFHSIIGLQENDPATSPWLPTDPLVAATCTGYMGALGTGDHLQGVSIMSQGLRFPICEFGGFDVVFQEIANNVVSAVPIACELPFPLPPVGEIIDPNTVQLDFTPEGGDPLEKFVQVPAAAQCTPSAFWIDGTTIHLCPDACARVNESGGNVAVRFGCDVGFIP